MMTLASQLETVAGKKKYGCLPRDVKATVDEIVNQMERLPAVGDCYQSWWKLQCQIEDFYSEKERQRPPLSEQKEFRSIKNAIIQEAEALRLGKVMFEDDGAEQSTADFSSPPFDCWELWILTQDDTIPLAERDEAAAKLIEIAEDDDLYAQYLVGRLYQDGPVLIPDSVAALHWFSQSAAQGNKYSQFFLDRWDSLQPPSVMLAATRLLHHMGRVFQEQTPSPSIPGGIQVDRKLMARIREKKIAMGHKPDDHVEHQGWEVAMR